MMTLPRLATLALAAGLMLLGLGGRADATALPGVTIGTAPQLEATPADIANFFGFTVFGFVSAETATTPINTGLLVSVVADIAPDGSFSSGDLAVSDGAAAWLNGTLSAVATTINATGDDTIELLFDTLNGSAAPEFGPRSVVTLVGEFGSAPFDPAGPLAINGAQGMVYVNPAVLTNPIPLPAALPLLVAGLGMLRLATRRQR
ncbi:MAG: hypothetical protein KDA50_07265 [Rhodobacteraceae bacterium]|nr:hypothetical protein [Paracoccaceae bacterium]